MTNTIINDDWLFKTNSKEQIALWISTLKYAYFWRRPSFRDDGDYITLSLNFTDYNDLIFILGKLGLELKKIPTDFPKPKYNRAYDWNEFKKFKSPIKDFPEYEQLSLTYIDDIPISIWIENGKITFNFSDSESNYQVSDKDYDNCLKFESILEKNELEEKVNREYNSNIGSITLEKYPHLKI